MSFRALNWAWEQARLSPVEKLLLVALADHADDETLQCNPGLQRLRARTCASERGLRNAIASLVSAGLIRHDVKIGVGATYTLLIQPRQRMPGPGHDPRQKSLPLTPAVSAGVEGRPRQPVPVTPAVSAAEPLGTESSTSPLSPGGAIPPPLRVVAGTAAGAEKPTLDPGKGTRLSADWRPSPEQGAFAAKLGLNPEFVAANFRDFWHAKAGKDGRKADWPATWRLWCRRDAERAQRPVNRPTAYPRQSRMDRWRDLMGEGEGQTIDGDSEPFHSRLAATGD